MNAVRVKNEIDQLISTLISYGLSVEQEFTSIKKVNSKDIVSWGKADDLSIVLKNIDYEEIYKAIDDEKNYNIKMIDGALIQMMYTFDGRELVSHRLAFFPSTFLKSFPSDEILYEQFDVYGDILKKNILPTVFRFDFNIDEELYVDVEHAKSHVTFGQYVNCRIPVSGPVSPSVFLDFILRNFYTNAKKHYNINLPNRLNFSRTISNNEEKILHFNLI